MTPGTLETRGNTSAAATTVLVADGQIVPQVAGDLEDVLREARFACFKIGLRHFTVA